MRQVPLSWLVAACLLPGCSASRFVVPALAPEPPETDLLILQHIGNHTALAPVMVLLPEADTLQHTIALAYVYHLPRATFDSTCRYFTTRLPVLLAHPACQCAYEGEPGAYKVTVKHHRLLSVYYLDCRACTRATFSTIRDEQEAHPDAPRAVRQIARTFAEGR
jgi:hypothetical protein